MCDDKEKRRKKKNIKSLVLKRWRYKLAIKVCQKVKKKKKVSAVTEELFPRSHLKDELTCKIYNNNNICANNNKWNNYENIFF